MNKFFTAKRNKIRTLLYYDITGNRYTVKIKSSKIGRQFSNEADKTPLCIQKRSENLSTKSIRTHLVDFMMWSNSVGLFVH